MGEKNDQYAHSAFGDTNRADSVPDLPEPGEGPVYLEGRLVLSLSFNEVREGETSDLDVGGAIERYRIWDDLSETWRGGGLEVLRFERADVVVRDSSEPSALWRGAIDTHARIIPVPDLDYAGMVANRESDLRWRRV